MRQAFERESGGFSRIYGCRSVTSSCCHLPEAAADCSSIYLLDFSGFTNTGAAHGFCESLRDVGKGIGN